MKASQVFNISVIVSALMMISGGVMAIFGLPERYWMLIAFVPAGVVAVITILILAFIGYLRVRNKLYED